MTDKSNGANVRIYNRKELVMALTLHMNTDETVDTLIRADRSIMPVLEESIDTIANQNVPSMCSHDHCSNFATHFMECVRGGMTFFVPICAEHAKKLLKPIGGEDWIEDKEPTRVKRMEIIHQSEDGVKVKNIADYEVGIGEGIKVWDERVGGTDEQIR